MGQLGQWARNHAGHLYRRPPRVEAAPEPVPPKAVEPLVQKAEDEVPPSAPPAPVSTEDEEEAPVRASVDSLTPGLAAAPV